LFFIPLFLLLKQLISSLQITAFPFDLFDLSLAFRIFSLLLLKLIDIILKFVFLKTSPLYLVYLLLLLSDLILESGHVIFFSLQTFLNLLFLFGDQGCLSFVNG
jgi:hypothetical protein